MQRYTAPTFIHPTQPGKALVSQPHPPGPSVWTRYRSKCRTGPSVADQHPITGF